METASITADEHELLSAYAKGEFVGGLLIGNLARHVSDDSLYRKLVRHAQEELTHAMDIFNAMQEIGLKPMITRDPKGEHMFAQVDRPLDPIDLLAMVEAFEEIIPVHYQSYIETPGTHPVIQRVLQKLVDDEVYHQSWVKAWFKTQPQELANSAREKYRIRVRNTYKAELERLKKKGGRLAAIADSAEKKFQDSENHRNAREG